MNTMNHSIMENIELFTLKMDEWIHSWKTNDWKNSEGKQVKNKDLWIRLDKLSKNMIYHGFGLKDILI